MQEKTDTEDKALLLAGEILRSTTTTLLLHMRFLESALFRLQPEAARTTFATNGQQLYYGFSFLFDAYRRDPVYLTRGYLHTLMHCIFRHPFISGTVSRQMWDLAADVAAEAAIEQLGLPAFDEARSQKIRPFLKKLRDAGIHLTAEKLYRHFLTHPEMQPEYEEMMPVFSFCDHSCWYSPVSDASPDADSDSENSVQDSRQENSGDEGQMRADSRREDPGDTEQKGADRQQTPSRGDGAPQENAAPKEDGGPKPAADRGSSKPQDGKETAPSCRHPQNARGSALDGKWSEISRRIQIDLETFSREAGDQAGSLLQNLRALNREKYDYRSFLLRFAQPREVMKVSEDEFDYNFYTYGLRLYGNVPLIEPLEYREDRRIREFAIVIDTSGSTSGDLVQTFLEKTYNILKTTETFDSRMHLRIIQADADIQESRLIHTDAELEAYIRDFRIRGGGGTDFRPAFRHVDELIHSGELRRLRGLIYFTDGFGTYPAKKPAYDSAFVFVGDTSGGFEPPQVPPWAIKLVLDTDEVAAI